MLPDILELSFGEETNVAVETPSAPTSSTRQRVEKLRDIEVHPWGVRDASKVSTLARRADHFHTKYGENHLKTQIAVVRLTSAQRVADLKAQLRNMKPKSKK